MIMQVIVEHSATAKNTRVLNMQTEHQPDFVCSRYPPRIADGMIWLLQSIFGVTRRIPKHGFQSIGGLAATLLECVGVDVVSASDKI